MRYFTGLILCLVGIAIGLDFPDVDHTFSFLVHRSIVTHGALVPLILFWVAYTYNNPMIRLFAIGFNSATAVHLAFDFFPSKWTGYALIHIPFYGRSSQFFSQVWIVISVIACLYLTISLAKNLLEIIITGGSLAGLFSIYAVKETLLWPPLVFLIIAGAIALILPSDIKNSLRHKTITIGDKTVWKAEKTE